MNKADESLRVLEDIYQESYVTDVRITNALSFAIETIKSIQSAEMPEKRGGWIALQGEPATYDEGFDTAIDLCTPIVAKLRAKVTELESRCGGCVL